MAEASILVSQDQFRCPVCLDLLKDPVAIPCGHSYCMSCITDCWNQDDQKRVYSCPQCRQTFSPRPPLFKNTILAEMVEKLKKTELPAAGPGDVECDICVGIKYKAFKSCLVCLNSYCQNHLEQHKNFFKGKQHVLIDADGRLQEMICHEHNKILEVYCRTDQQCICMMCWMDQHENHETVKTAAERTEKQKLLGQTLRKHKQRIKQRMKEFKELEEAVESHKRSAQTAVDDCEMMFTELISSIERSRSEMTQLIRDQEKAAVRQAEELFMQLEKEINDLKRKDTALEELLHTDDHIHFLQSFQSLCAPPEYSDLLNITVNSLFSFNHVGKSVSLLKAKLEDFCQEELKKITDKVRHTRIIPIPDPKTRDEFLQYSCQLTLDPNTLYTRLHMDEKSRMVTYTDTNHKYPHHPERFLYYPQVLCRESVCGCSYWEVEWNGMSGCAVEISVSYKSISRKIINLKSVFGGNDQSWSLSCSSSKYTFFHNNKPTDVTVPSSCCRIGVYVDYIAGILSFYNVCPTEMILIHRVYNTFSQPLYPGFYVSQNASVKLCDLTDDDM